MTISTIITNDIAIKPLTEKISTLKNIFNEMTYTHIPITDGEHYIGSISEDDIRSFEDTKTVEDYRYALNRFYAFDHAPTLNMLKVFTNNYTNILPILDWKTKAYLGYLELNDVLVLLDKTPFFGSEGVIVVIEKGRQDYSFSEISQIVESNQGKLYGAFISSMTDSKVRVTLKINESAINGILQTFRRYDYLIISEHEEDSFLQNLEERSEYLNKYLNI